MKFRMIKQSFSIEHMGLPLNSLVSLCLKKTYGLLSTLDFSELPAVKVKVG
jgi:hypothetical protein